MLTGTPRMGVPVRRGPNFLSGGNCSLGGYPVAVRN